MPDLKTTQQVFNMVFRTQDGGLLDTLASEQAVLGLVLDEASGRLKVQVTGGIGRSGHKLGSWSEDYEYYPGDIVNYDGRLYKCALSGSGDPPDTSTTYWEAYSDGALGEKYVRATWYQAISSATGGAGAIGLPPDNPSAGFVFNEWPDGIDAVLCGLDGDGRPDEATVFTAGGEPVYIPADGGLSGDGAYSLSGIPAALPCALIYRYRCKLRDFNENYALSGYDFEQGLELENLLGTPGQIMVTNNGDSTLTLAIPNPLIIAGLQVPLTGVLKGNGGSSAVTAMTGTINQVAKWTPDGNTLGVGVIYDNGANVGVGTTNPGYKLDVNGIVASGNISGNGEFRSYQTTAGNYVALKTAGLKSGLYRSNTDYFLWYDISTGNTNISGTYNNSSIIFNYQGSELARINKDGNLGIGTATFGSGAVKNLVLALGTESNVLTDAVSLLCADRAAGKAGLLIKTEDGTKHIFSDYCGIGTTNPGAKLQIDVLGGGSSDTVTSNSVAGIFVRGTQNDGNYDDVGIKFGFATGDSYNAFISLHKTSSVNQDLIIGTHDTARIRITGSGRTGIGTATPIAKLHIDQSSSTAAIPVLLLDQADDSEAFTKLIGTAASGVLTQSLVADADVTTPTLIGWEKVEVQDDGNQIADGAYYRPLYTLA